MENEKIICVMLIFFEILIISRLQTFLCMCRYKALFWKNIVSFYRMMLIF
jgi:hypothetical protein